MYNLLMEFPERNVRFSALYKSDPVFHQRVNTYYNLDDRIRLLVVGNQSSQLATLTLQRIVLREIIYRQLLAPDLVLIAAPQRHTKTDQQSSNDESINGQITDIRIRCHPSRGCYINFEN